MKMLARITLGIWIVILSLVTTVLAKSEAEENPSILTNSETEKTPSLIQLIIAGKVTEVSDYLAAANSPDVFDEQGNTALLVAVSHQQLPIAKLLLKAQANPDVDNAAGMTALMLATHNQADDMMQLLLEQGANVNLQNRRNGYTALMYAVENNDMSAIERLLQYHADVNIRNYESITPMEIAQARGYTDIFQKLLFSDWNVVSPDSTPSAAATKPATSPTPPTNSAVTESLAKADYLLNQHQLRLAREILKDGYRATGDMTLLNRWLEVDQRLFAELKTHNQQRAVSQLASVSALPQSRSFLANRQWQIQYEINNPITTLPFTKVDQILEGYEQLKISLIELGTILQDKIRKIASQELPATEQQWRQYQSMVKEVKHYRYGYISFDVLSPYLARAEQQIFLAENTSSLFSPYSPEILQQAVITLAKTDHQNILFEAAPEVREQFFRVYSLFRNLAKGQIQMEELFIVQKIADKLRTQGFTVEEWWSAAN
jgi:uncharacterized protein YaaQ